MGLGTGRDYIGYAERSDYLSQLFVILIDGFELVQNDPQLVENFDSKVWSDYAP